jgi:hypothetical protein
MPPSVFGVINEISSAPCGSNAFHAPRKRKLAIAQVGNFSPANGSGLSAMKIEGQAPRGCGQKFARVARVSGFKSFESFLRLSRCARRAFRATVDIHGTRALALLTHHLKVDFAAARAFYAKVHPRSMPAPELNTVCCSFSPRSPRCRPTRASNVEHTDKLYRRGRKNRT